MRCSFATCLLITALLFSLIVSSSHASDNNLRTVYTAYDFSADEGWGSQPGTETGNTALDGNTWQLDFSSGAKSLSLYTPDNLSLPGTPKRFRLRITSSAEGLSLRIHIRSHFMTFYRDIGTLSGEGIEELVFDAPPGEGWQWYGGENDGKVHGALRIFQIEAFPLEGQGSYTVTLEALTVEVECPADRRIVSSSRIRQGTGRDVFETTVRAVSECELTGRCSWEFRSWDGEKLGGGDKSVTIPSDIQPFTIEIPVPDYSREYKFIEATFSFDVPGQVVRDVTSCWLAPLENTGDTELNPDSPFGMGVYLYRFGSDEQSIRNMERTAEMAKEAGVKWSREEFQWHRIEPEKGTFDWEFYDRMLDCTEKNGISVYAICAYWSYFTQPYTEEGIEDYCDYLRAMVSRYKDRVKQWEIWNEPNIFFWSGPKELYPVLLKKSYAAIKEADPDALVLGCSTAGIDTGFIKMTMDAGAPFDILTIHPYRGVFDDQEFMDELTDAWNLVDRKPVWITEIGFAIAEPHNSMHFDFAYATLREHANLITRVYLSGIVSGVDPKAFWYNFRDDGVDPVNIEHCLGITYNDFTPKPSYITYATMTRVIGNSVPGNRIDTGDNTFCWEFTDSETGAITAYAVWNTESDRTVYIPLGKTKRPAMVVNAVGEETKAEVINGKIAVQLRKDAPMYIMYK